MHARWAGQGYPPWPRQLAGNASVPSTHLQPPLLLHSADEEFDEFLGIGTGAAALFGTTGGVMEAALRCSGQALSILPHHNRLVARRGWQDLLGRL